MKTYLLFLLFFFVQTGTASDRIINGYQITGREAPWQLSLESRFGSHFCGAVLVAKNVALTAAHCVWTSSPSDLSVNGASSSGALNATQKVAGVKDIVIHPKFERKNFTAHDLAILVLTRDVKTSQTVGVIDLPRASFSYTLDQDFHAMTGVRFVTSGWGMTTPPNLLENPSDQLMAIEQYPIASSNISLLLPSVKQHLRDHYDIGDRTIERIQSFDAMTLVAEGENQLGGTCSADSGGPLVMIENGTATLVGLSSYTAGGEKKCLGVSVYSNVQAYLPWIEGEILRAGIQ